MLPRQHNSAVHPNIGTDLTRVFELAEAAAPLSLEDLRSLWHRQFGRKAPAKLGRGLLYRLLIYRMQVEEFGDIAPHIARQLEQIGVDRDRPTSNPNQGVLRPGTILVREHAGVRYPVSVTQSGFTWDGREFRSLSAVAHAITGTKWNGHRFFGLKGQR